MTNLDDELDALFNYNPYLPDDNDANTKSQSQEQSFLGSGAGWGRTPGGAGDDVDLTGGLGIDEAVKVKNKRAPRPKLDDDLLLSAKGVPRLQRIMKKQLRFKGKGHEFSDIARMLSLYQVWLDDMFPSVKFKDGLDMIEKIGHTRRLQTARREWLDAGNPNAKRFTTTVSGEEQEEESDRRRQEEANQDDLFDSIFGPKQRNGDSGSGIPNGSSRANAQDSVLGTSSAMTSSGPKTHLTSSSYSNPTGSTRPTSKLHTDSMVDIHNHDGDSDFEYLMGNGEPPSRAAGPSFASSSVDHRPAGGDHAAPAGVSDGKDVPNDDELEALLQEELGSASTVPPTQTHRDKGKQNKSHEDGFSLDRYEDLDLDF